MVWRKQSEIQRTARSPYFHDKGLELEKISSSKACVQCYWTTVLGAMAPLSPKGDLMLVGESTSAEYRVADA